ncbi:MAG: methionyl-tRNA formyltransferase [Pseudomonadota bacterium]
MTKLKIIFAGTPEFALPSLQVLLEDSTVDLVGVYTQPDRAAGRGRKITESPVKKLAAENGLAICQPHRFDEQTCRAFTAGEIDLLVVAAYGIILPKVIIDHPRIASLNVHASLLPRWRGAAPIERAIMAGDAKTGICIMRMVEALDAGPIWCRRETDIEAHTTGGALHDNLAHEGAVALRQTIAQIHAGTATENTQDEQGVTYAKKITTADRAINWYSSAIEIERQVRALFPTNSPRAKLGELDNKIIEARAIEHVGAQRPGTIVSLDANLVVATGSGALEILRVQPPGKKPMSAADFIRGYGDKLGECA